MCLGCANADSTKVEDRCNGHIRPYMTLKQLMADVQAHAAKTQQHLFRIYRKGLLDPPPDQNLSIGDLQIQFL